MRILILLFLSAFAACNKETASGTPMPVVPQAGGKTYLALGDSYTIGQSVEVAERFPAQTVNLLRQQGIAVADPIYIARTGWTTDELQAAMASQPLATYDVVSLLIGVNDQYRGRDTTSYRQRFTQLLERSIQLAGGRKAAVFVLSIPDYSVTPFVPASDKERVRREVDLFNGINRRITESMGVSYTDITPSSREGATNPSLIAQDGLHPSGREYAKWAALLAPKMAAVLR
jgi:lysophospholipase L1-like esterase